MPDTKAQLQQTLALQLRSEPFSNPAQLRRCRHDWSEVLRKARTTGDRDTAAFAVTVLQWLGEAHTPRAK
jgi:hypothetical protein